MTLQGHYIFFLMLDTPQDIFDTVLLCLQSVNVRYVHSVLSIVSAFLRLPLSSLSLSLKVITCWLEKETSLVGYPHFLATCQHNPFSLFSLYTAVEHKSTKYYRLYKQPVDGMIGHASTVYFITSLHTGQKSNKHGNII